MTNFNLKSPTIGAIREFVGSQTLRGDLKELALKAGADAARIMTIKISGNIRKEDYKSKKTLMDEMFDTVYEDFEKPEADGICLRMIGLLLGPEQGPVAPFSVSPQAEVSQESLEKLERGLAKSGLSIAQITDTTVAGAVLDAALEQTQDSDMQEATDLIMKALRRLPTDKPGAITACTTACESVCRIALERLRLPLPKSKQLPDYLKTLCRQSNIRALAGFGGEGTRRVFGNLQGLAQNSYRAAHELGDRHAGGNSASEPSAFAASLLVTSCATLTIIIAGAIAHNEIELTH